MVVNKGSLTISVDLLSDREKCTLALIGDLARRIALANPNRDNPLDGEGIVLIDEIELHMHPSWQRRVLGFLKRVFPNIQFIVTTHSPQILGEVDDNFNVYNLFLNEKMKAEVKMHSRLDGYDSNMIKGGTFVFLALSLFDFEFCAFADWVGGFHLVEFEDGIDGYAVFFGDL